MKKINIIIILLLFFGFAIVGSSLIFQHVHSDSNVCKQTCDNYNMQFVQIILAEDGPLRCECTSPEQKYLIVEAKK